SEVFRTRTTFDALNRPVTVTTPDNSVLWPVYNEANLLERLDANLRGSQTATSFVTNIDYNARGQRVLVEYGNNVKTEYEYDRETFRLRRLTTTRRGFAPSERIVQDLSYTYDPVGNITHIQDDADIQNVVFFRNQRVEPSNDYVYDAIYRLKEATGREHLGQVGAAPQPTSPTDAPRVNLPHPNDGNAMARYTDSYNYDAVGNFLQVLHRAATGGWSRAYSYDERSLIEPARKNNRLSSTTILGNNPITEPSSHDAHGNMTAMPHLPLMEWDYKDQLHATQRQVVNNTPGEKTYYVYDAAGERARKVTDRSNGSKKQERIYLGSFEVYREYNGSGSVTLERETLHVMDDKERIALLETRTQGNDGSLKQVMRYQFYNHLGSACVELDQSAAVISYEEYYAYGSSSYQAGSSATEVSVRRYRYAGKERDEETDCTYHGARYSATWLGRWLSPEPGALTDGLNVYWFCRCNPVRWWDPDGKQPVQQKVLDFQPLSRYAPTLT